MHLELPVEQMNGIEMPNRFFGCIQAAAHTFVP
jgi:hypothetical protein